MCKPIPANQASGATAASYPVLIKEVKLIHFLLVPLLKVDWICAGMRANAFPKSLFCFPGMMLLFRAFINHISFPTFLCILLCSLV